MASNPVPAPAKSALTRRQREALIAKIENLPAQVRTLVKGAKAQELDTPYREGGWTSRQVVHHLADSHMNAYVRARLIMTEDNPTLRPYSQDAWAALDDAAKGPLEPSLKILEGVHRRWAALFRSVGPEAWSRPANHPEYGPTSLEGILRTYSGHGELHLGHIKKGLALARKRT